MKKKGIIIIFLLLITCGNSPDNELKHETVLSPEEKEWIQKNRSRQIIIATENYEDWMNFNDRKKSEHGYLSRITDIVNMEHNLNLKVLNTLSYRDIYKKFINKEIDGFYNCDSSLLTEDFIHTEPLASITLKCYTNSKSIDSLAKLENKTAGFIYNQPSYEVIIKNYNAILHIGPHGASRDLPYVVGDRVQLQQVMMNLITNSIDAMKEADGTRELAIKSGRAEDDQLAVCVSDTGVGLPPQRADQIFNTFFTTKPNGTGMGLSICRSIVESHGGRLWATDNIPRGANFHLVLARGEPQGLSRAMAR